VLKHTVEPKATTLSKHTVARASRVARACPRARARDETRCRRRRVNRLGRVWREMPARHVLLSTGVESSLSCPIKRCGPNLRMCNHDKTGQDRKEHQRYHRAISTHYHRGQLTTNKKVRSQPTGMRYFPTAVARSTTPSPYISMSASCWSGRFSYTS